jgi:hypothetical protein
MASLSRGAQYQLELARLAPERVVVLGGSTAISNTVVQAINAVVP